MSTVVPIPLGAVHMGSVPFFIQEAPVNSAELSQEQNFTVEVVLPGGVALANLQDIRAMKQLLIKAENRLLLREEQALRSKNMTLDLG